MPCSDITELISVRLDREGRLHRYRLSKQTCGGSLGRPALILGWARGQSPQELLAADPAAFLASASAKSLVSEVVHLKHFFALRAAVAALEGLADSDPEAPCALESVEYGPDGVVLKGVIRIDAMTAEIAACEGCGTGSVPPAD